MTSLSALKGQVYSRSVLSHETLEQLLEDRMLCKEIRSTMPKTCHYMRINRGWAMFYLKDTQERPTRFAKPLRYLRYKDQFVELNLTMTWDEFAKVNHIIDVMDFRFMYAMRYPIDDLGLDEAKSILEHMPLTATHYNVISMHYQKAGEHGQSLICVGVDEDGAERWVESAHDNQFIEDRLLGLTKLHYAVSKETTWNKYPFHF